MKKKHILLIFLVFEASILFYGNSFLGLFESSEARYAEVSREMLETGDYISPQMDYVYHFTKPPLAYYLTALGMSIFGVNPFGARFFVTIFALLTLFLAFRISEEFEQDGICSMLILGSFPLFFIMGKVLTTDMFLTFFVTAGVYLFILYQKGKLAKNRFSLLFGIVLGLSILTKGQVGIIYFAMIYLGLKFFNKEDYSLKVFLSPFLWIVAFLVSGWWFIAVGIKHQGLLQYLFFREAVEASYSSKRFHPGPFYYYIPVMLGGLFPFWLLFPSLKNLITDRKIKSLFGYTIFPLVLFSFFPAKLPTYLLPSTPGWALLFNERKEKKQFLQMISIIMSVFLICISFLVYSQGEKYVGKNLKEVSLILIVGSLFSLFAFIASYRKSEFVVITALFVSILFSSLSIPTLVAKNQEKFKIAQEMALSIKEKIQKEDEVLELRTTIFSVPFYLQKKVYAFDNNFFRKKFLKDKPEHILQTEEELNEFIGKTPLLWVIVDRKSENYLRENYPQYQPYFKGSRYIVYVSPEIKRRLGD